MVPREPRTGLDAFPSLPLRTARLRPGGSTQTGESQASNSCCSAGPPRPPSPCSPAVHPQPAPGPPGATPRELQEGAQIAAPSSLSTKSWAGVFLACSQVIMALTAGCVVTHRDLDGLFIADGFGLRGSQQVVVKPALLRNPAFLPALLQNSPGDHCAAHTQATHPLALPRIILLALGSSDRKDETWHQSRMGRWHSTQENRELWKTPGLKCPPRFKHHQTHLCPGAGSDAQPRPCAFS